MLKPINDIIFSDIQAFIKNNPNSRIKFDVQNGVIIYLEKTEKSKPLELAKKIEKEYNTLIK